MQTSLNNNQQSQSNKFLLNNYRVLIRCRPLTKKQIELCQPNKRQKIVRKHQNTLYFYEPDIVIPGPLKFQFDRIFLQNQRNLQIFKVLQESIDNFMNGFNTSVMAYGQTGAGKSYTMFGNQYSEQYKQQGLISFAIKQIMSKTIKEDSLKMSYMQLYNEQLRDLLIQKSENLSIMQDNIKGISIPQLTQYPITSYQQFCRLVKLGTSRRSIANTSSNLLSSRSHCIIQVSYIRRKQKQIISSKIHFVDLAGSERASDNKGIRLQQGGNINKSLLALGNCINCLKDNNNNKNFIPYRDSKLTRLLKDSLGGNAKTILIVCISPSYLSYQETLNALKYASRALKIKKQVTANIKQIKSDEQTEIEKLNKEIVKLKNLLNQKQNPYKTSYSNFSPKLLQKKDKSLIKLSRDYSPNVASTKNLKQKEKKLQREVQNLKKIIMTKDLLLIQKDDIIKKMQNQLNMLRKQNKSPLKKICNQSFQSKKLINKEQISPKVMKEKSLNKLLSKNHEIMTLQNVREKTRLFKSTLKQVYDQYQNLEKKDKIPKHLVQIIQSLIKQYRKGNIMLSEEYTNVLFEFRNLIQLSQI